MKKLTKQKQYGSWDHPKAGYCGVCHNSIRGNPIKERRETGRYLGGKNGAFDVEIWDYCKFCWGRLTEWRLGDSIVNSGGNRSSLAVAMGLFGSEKTSERLHSRSKPKIPRERAE